MGTNLASLVVLTLLVYYGLVALIRVIIKHDKINEKKFDKSLDIYRAWWYND